MNPASSDGTSDVATASFSTFVELVAARINRPLDGARPGDRLVEDLDLDSIAMLELFVLLEETAVYELPVELVDSLETLGDVWHWYGTLTAQRGNGVDLSNGTAHRPGEASGRSKPHAASNGGS